MIYKRLPRQIRHTKLRYVTGVSAASSSSGSTMFLVTRHVPAAILRTSRQVYAEAYDIVTALIQKFVRESHPRAIGHDAGLDALAGLMYVIGDECAKLAVSHEYLNLLEWLIKRRSDRPDISYATTSSVESVFCLLPMANRQLPRCSAFRASDCSGDSAEGGCMEPCYYNSLDRQLRHYGGSNASYHRYPRQESRNQQQEPFRRDVWRRTQMLRSVAPWRHVSSSYYWVDDAHTRQCPGQIRPERDCCARELYA
jgi:hypothetical protein